MITLMGLRDYLVERGRASVSDIGVHFHSSPDAARQAVEHWVAKGRARRIDAGGGCCPKAGGACACDGAPPEVYEWTGPRPA